MNYFKLPGLVATCLMSGLLFIHQAWAQELSEYSGTTWGLGAAAGVMKKPYAGYGTDYSALPILFLDNQWIQIAGPGMDLKLGNINDFSFTLHTEFGLDDGYKSSDAPILNGMAKRKGSIWVGPSMTWKNTLGQLTAKVLTDASSYSQGQQAAIEASKGYQYNKFEFTPYLGTAWVSSKYADYYYGVKANEARADRATYSGQSTVNANAGIRANYYFTDHQTFMIDINFRWYGSGITDSPLVNKSSAPEALAGYMYTF